MGGAECPSGSGCEYGNLAGGDQKLSKLNYGIAQLEILLKTGQNPNINSPEVKELAEKMAKNAISLTGKKNKS